MAERSRSASNTSTVSEADADKFFEQKKQERKKEVENIKVSPTTKGSMKIRLPGVYGVNKQVHGLGRKTRRHHKKTQKRKQHRKTSHRRK